ARQERNREIARSLLGLLPPDVIAERTGLTTEDVQALQEQDESGNS
ncbi:MAG: Rpn family recombination-promoting nuclease/putative transposase, partial [Prochlorothrix sp.]